MDMNLFHRMVISFSTFLLAALLGCASATRSKAQGLWGRHRDGSQGKGGNLQEPFAKINAETFKGVVQLSDFVNPRKVVDAFDPREAAVDTARNALAAFLSQPEPADPQPA
jgi:hypothetical protein